MILYFRTDLSYFDGMNSTIFAVALVEPKPNVFQAHIKYLLVLATGLNIAILGVTFKKVTGTDGNYIISLYTLLLKLLQTVKLVLKIIFNYFIFKYVCDIR